MSLSCRSASVFGPSAQYIKINGGDFVAIEGSNILERLITSDLRMPYRQILKSRIILKPGQVNYLLNFLGLGDNATFLAIKAVYNGKSVLEEDNVIHWSFYDDLSKVYSFAQLMVLTGNSSNRVKQLYLTNPNPNYAISLDVMVGVIDDNYSFFSDTLNQVGTSFTGLSYTDIKSHVIGESIVINDKSTPVRPLIYINIVNILMIEKTSTILIVDDSSFGSIFLQFLTEYDAFQAQSLLNYVIENPNVNIDTLSPVSDTLDPIVYFYSTVGASASGSYITFNGATTSVPYNTSQGFTFSTSISLTTFGSASVIDKTLLNNLLISGISDNRDGTMSMMPSNLIITGPTSSVSTISGTGSYVLTFNFSDIAYNQLDGVNVSLNITN
jgi:hypothetical protein